jgi:hypothetical protein
MSEYDGKSEEQRKAVKLYRDTLAGCISYCRPYFEQGVRFYRLFRGIMPPEIDGTFSKVMLNHAWAMIETECSKSLRSVLTNPQWFSVEAKTPDLEFQAENARQWLQYQMERVQKIAVTSVPSVQAAHIFGTGYRIYTHKFKVRKTQERVMVTGRFGIPQGFEDKVNITKQSVISGQYADFFTVFPIPGGGQVNAIDDSCSQMVRGVIWIDYMSRKDLEAQANSNPKWNKREMGAMFDRNPSSSEDVSAEYRDKLNDSKGGWYNFRQPEWLNIYNQDNGLDRQYRVGWMWLRDRWIVVGEDQFLLYDDKPLIEDCLPLAKFAGSFDLNEWFGIGLIEMTEDLILSIMLNLNHRLDYLAGTLHPTTWASERIMQALGGDKSLLDPEPYGVNVFPTMANLSTELVRERFPEISQQAFLEDAKMQEWLQMVTGQPNYSTGAQTSVPDNATGIISLIAEGAARSYLRAINIENTGLLDCLWLTMKYGSKYRNDDEIIRVGGSSNQWPWREIPATAISDQYELGIAGTRDMNLQAETFRKMLQLLTTITSIPGLADNPKEAARQTLRKAACFDNVDDIIGKSTDMSGVGGMLPGLGGAADAGGMNTLENQNASLDNRSSVEPSTGRQVLPMGA